jgi:hypothetical protein
MGCDCLCVGGVDGKSLTLWEEVSNPGIDGHGGGEGQAGSSCSLNKVEWMDSGHRMCLSPHLVLGSAPPTVR